MCSSDLSPVWVSGERLDAPVEVRENGVRFELRFCEGYSVGLFLDQRDNRRRLLTGHVAAGFPWESGGRRPKTLLNLFAYTCGFSVCAALGGMHTVSVDLSKKYLDWGRRQFEINGISLDGHDFIFGDWLDWARRLARKGRTFDAVVVDPPTFSRSKAGGTFRAEADYGSLVASVMPLVARDGVLFVSTNAARWRPEHFVDVVEQAVSGSGRRVVHRHFVPQPPDFPVSRDEPAYLKTLWLRLGG